jgi:hypothetical protein
VARKTTSHVDKIIEASASLMEDITVGAKIIISIQN